MNKSFIERLKANDIVYYKLPNAKNEFSDYREKLSIRTFSEYLYSLRHFYDIKNMGNKYFG